MGTIYSVVAFFQEGGLFMWSEQQEGSDFVTSGNPNFNNSSAAALLSYDVAHSIPWDWRVSLYTWTKGIASGVYLVACLLVLLGAIDVSNPIWLWFTPIVSGGFLAITGGLLLWDLEHPERFYLIFTRPQWRSWLVRGGVIIAAYGAVLAAHFFATATGNGHVGLRLATVGGPLAVLTAVYTAWLFAQAKARDMWQNPLLPPHFAVQALLAGCAAVLPLAAWLYPPAVWPLLQGLAVAGGAHLLFVLGECTLPHSTAHARLATREMTSGRYRTFFRAGVVLILAAVLAPWIGIHSWGFALLALLAHEHAYVQAGQSVPLA